MLGPGNGLRAALMASFLDRWLTMTTALTSSRDTCWSIELWQSWTCWPTPINILLHRRFEIEWGIFGIKASVMMKLLVICRYLTVMAFPCSTAGFLQWQDWKFRLVAVRSQRRGVWHFCTSDYRIIKKKIAGGGSWVSPVKCAHKSISFYHYNTIQVCAKTCTWPVHPSARLFFCCSAFMLDYCLRLSLAWLLYVC